MNVVKVNASTAYEVMIGSGLLFSLGNEVAKVTKVGTAAIISDSNVWPLYGKTAQESLENTGLFFLLVKAAKAGLPIWS